MAHMANRSYFSIPNFYTYVTPHPLRKAHGGTALIIRNKIKHHEIDKISKIYIQATSTSVEVTKVPILLTVVYCPPGKIIKDEHFNMLGHHFIAVRDFKAKEQCRVQY